jgi:hypothetical protein
VLFLTLRAALTMAFFDVATKAVQSSGGAAVDSESFMQVNEELTFEARYLFFKLGSVRFQVLGKTEYDGRPAYLLRASIDSYSGVPFVNFHAVYDTYADANTLFCLFSSRSQKEGDDWLYTTTNFEFDRKIIEWEQTRNGNFVKKVDLPMDRSYTNGVSFVYFVRKMCHDAHGKQTSLDVPIIDDTVRSRVTMTIDENREPCSVTAFDFPLDAYRLSGHINFTGSFGLTGDFIGWMGTDSSAVPLKADVKVWLGSVVVQLKAIKKANWTPPRTILDEKQ